MKNYLSIENLAKSYTERILFENLTFGLNKGEKAALVARNGTGKSSLLKIIAGMQQADEGKVVIRDGIRIGYLQQDPDFPPEMTVVESIKTGHPKINAVILEYELALESQHISPSAETRKALDSAIARMDHVNAWDHERRMKQVLTVFKIMDLDQPTGLLSGGQKKRLALALAIIDKPELILLDEPTNHLDIDMIEWLEQFLSESSVTLLMVTHDRYFLDRVCNKILEIDGGQLFQYQGNYSRFLELKSAREETLQTETDKARQLMKSELEWIRRMPKARTTKSKSRIDAFADIQKKAVGKKQEKDVRFEVNMQRIGGKILELENLYKSFNTKCILKSFSYSFRKGERIGIIGKNGSGKTTFLNIISGKVKHDSGSVTFGDTITYGYYTQEGIHVPENKRVIEVLQNIAEVFKSNNERSLTPSQLLQQFLFTPEMQYTMVSKLSGGEIRRLHLLMVLMKSPNFLILDEPTNDLDIATLNKLEEFLESYAGCLIIVSHDRFFLDKLADHLFIFQGDGLIEDYTGNYSSYRRKVDEEGRVKRELSETKSKEPFIDKSGREKKQAKKPGFKEKLEYEKLEKEIKELEQEKLNLETSLQSGTQSYEQLHELSSRIAGLIKLMDEKTMRWLELDDLLQR
jgi:ABC transport system ATP-binding/permease protein